MGFFSSRRAEPTTISTKPPPADRDDKDKDRFASVRVIRSKFYGRSTTRHKPDGVEDISALPIPPAEPSSSSSAQRTLRGTPSAADAITVSLAQRLNELAAANAEGFLDDDEYRALRQDLFERFASKSDLPSEAPLVKTAGPPRVRSLTHPTHPQSKLHPGRAPSVQSQVSFKSAVSSLLRKSTRRHLDVKGPGSDAMSVVSGVSASSRASTTFSRSVFSALRRQPSGSSIRTQASQAAYEFPTISSRRSARSIIDTPDQSPRSTMKRSARWPMSPPSSFATRQRTESGNEEEHGRTVAELYTEIEMLESEGHRIMDAFNGLELSTLSRMQSGAGINPTDRSRFLTEASGHRIRRRTSRHQDFSPLKFSSASTTSLTSVSSEEHFNNSTTRIALSTSNHFPSPSTPRMRDPSSGGVLYSFSLNRSGKLPAVIPESDEFCREGIGQPSLALPAYDDHGLEAELEEIRRRKAEYMTRHQQRLDYLRAKLKGAELHEKLLRK